MAFFLAYYPPICFCNTAMKQILIGRSLSIKEDAHDIRYIYKLAKKIEKWSDFCIFHSMRVYLSRIYIHTFTFAGFLSRMYIIGIIRNKKKFVEKVFFSC